MHVLLYGATGYTGELIARAAAAAGVPLVLAGRSETKLRPLAALLGCEYRVFELSATATVHRATADAAAVVNCAGPFVHTWGPLVDGCITGRTHYIDITGEIDVFEGIAARDAAARAAGVMLLPGAGFDVVPSDCLAAHLARRLPGAVRLLLGISGTGPLSHGTAATVIENQDRGGRVRRGGRIIDVPAAWRTRVIDFGDGREYEAVTIPWGDVATAYHSTGIPDIEVYAAAPGGGIRAIRMMRHLNWLLRRGPVKRLQRMLLRMRPRGPDAQELERGESRVWGLVEDAAGGRAEAVLRGPNGYRFTVDAALHALQRVLHGDAPHGFRTPSTAYGADFVLGIPGTERRDVW